MASNSKSLNLSSVSAPSVPVSRPRASMGASILRAVRRAFDGRRDEPPDIPGAIGASDRELMRLSRPEDVYDSNRWDDAIHLSIVGRSLGR